MINEQQDYLICLNENSNPYTDLVCSICGENHETELCIVLKDVKHVQDSKTQSRARLTLPPGLEVKILADGSSTVVSKVFYSQGTQFGPFEAPLTRNLHPGVALPFKVFAKTGTDGYFLDTTEEEACNWMCLVAPATYAREQNLICFDMKQKIYFTTTRDVLPNEELKVWYAFYYGLKLNALPLADNQPIEDRLWEHTGNDVDAAIKAKSDCLSGKDLVENLAPNLSAQTLGAKEKSDCWKCKKCGAEENSIANFARHLMRHYSRSEVTDIQLPRSPSKENFNSLNKVNIGSKLTEFNEASSQVPENDNEPQPSHAEFDPMAPIVLQTNIPSELQMESTEGLVTLDSGESVTFVLVDAENAQHVPPNDKHLDFSENLERPKSKENNLNFISHSSKVTTTEKKCQLDLVRSVKAFDDNFNENTINGELTTYKVEKIEEIESTDCNKVPFSNIDRAEAELISCSDDLEGSLNEERGISVENKKDSDLCCDICNKKFEKQAYLYRHLRKHTGEFTCASCLTAFARKENLLSHACARPNVHFPCSTCGKKFPAEKYLRRHLPIHSEKFACQECKRPFASKLSLKMHRCAAKSSRDNLAVCGLCHRVFSNKRNLGVHLKRHSKVTPALRCSETNSFSNITKSSNKKYFDGIECDNKDTTDQGADKEYICEVCGAVFKCISSMKTHSYIHGERRFECAICKKRFHRKDVLQDHLTVHGAAKIPCPICGKLFKTNKSLSVHMLIHNGSRRFSCGECGKDFFQKGNLVKHQLTHAPSSQRVFQCAYCNKTFTSKEYYTLHCLEHTQGKIFLCEICNKSFVKKHLLATHKQLFHKNRAFLCRYCNTLMRHRHSIRRHLEQRHNEQRSEWSGSGFIDKCFAEIPEDKTLVMGNGATSAAENLERQFALLELRRKHFNDPSITVKGDLVEKEGEKAENFLFTVLPNDTQVLNEQADHMVMPSQHLSVFDNMLSSCRPQSRMPTCSEEAVTLSSSNIKGGEILFTLVQQSAEEDHGVTMLPTNDGSINGDSTFVMDDGNSSTGLLLYVLEDNDTCNQQNFFWDS